MVVETNRNLDVLFLVDGGIGNVLEALYAVEYCLANKKKTGVYIHSLNRSFVSFLSRGYGADTILDSLENISTEFLIQSFTYVEDVRVPFEHYFYVKPDGLSTKLFSETELYLNIVKGLFGSGGQNKRLQFLPENYSEEVKKLRPENKIVLYPGCSAGVSAKRWPYFMDLMNKLGPENTFILGSREDLNFQYSYYYPKWVTRLPQKILNRRSFYNSCKKLGLLKPHAQFTEMDKLDNAYMNKFSWEELVAIFNRCKYFVGNDGGLMHLAACCGAPGKAIFGPTSVEKNKAYNELMVATHLQFDCQPCSLGDKGVSFADGMIACPYQLRCQYSLTVDIIEKGIPEANNRMN
jgi:ADP-heptose:LPS heptosyltransferase